MKRIFNNGNGSVVHARVATATGTIENAVVIWRNGVITHVGAVEETPDPLLQNLGEPIDADGDWLLPGFIDVHVHGGYGSDFMEATVEAYRNITAFHARNGTTGMLATTVTAPKHALQRVLETSVEVMSDRDAPVAELYGVHLEGPFISPKWPGAQNPHFIAHPDQGWLQDCASQYPGLIRMVTLAPELPGALSVIEWLTENRIIAASGHTDASYDEMKTAAGKGLSHSVHTFNAMRSLHHREPGTVGAVLTDSRIYAEIIADGHHVHPACIQLLLTAKSPDRVLLVTDAISAAGLADGSYSLGGQEVIVQDKVARLKDENTLAGSTITMIDAFRYIVREVGLSVPEASMLASGNPAKRLHLHKHVGSVAKGHVADMIRMTDYLELVQVWKRGNPISMKG